MKKLLFVAIAFAGLALVSCNKDQAAVKKLDGTWNATAATSVTGGVSIDLLTTGSSYTMTFNSCKLKKDEWCTGSVAVGFGGATLTSDVVYKVTGDGTVLTSQDHADSTASAESMNIVELSKTDATFEQVDGTTTTTFTMSKQ